MGRYHSLLLLLLLVTTIVSTYSRITFSILSSSASITAANHAEQSIAVLFHGSLFNAVAPYSPAEEEELRGGGGQ